MSDMKKLDEEQLEQVVQYMTLHGMMQMMCRIICWLNQRTKQILR